MTRMLNAMAPNGLLMVEENAPDTLNGGCGWTSDPRRAASFAGQEDARKRIGERWPLVLKWILSGEVKLVEAS